MSKLYEYMIVQGYFANKDELHKDLNFLGAMGWEAVSAVPSPNSPLGATYQVVMKRQRLSLAEPADTPPAWLADPSGRFQQRYWDGLRWTENVASDGVQSVDLPVPS